MIPLYKSTKTTINGVKKLIHEGNYEDNKSAQAMEGYSFQIALKELRPLLPHVRLLVADGDSSISKLLYKDWYARYLIDSGRLMLGRDWGHFRKSVCSTLKRKDLLGDRKWALPFKEKIANWISYPVYNGRKHNWTFKTVSTSAIAF
jgi:hypothetical protein